MKGNVLQRLAGYCWSNDHFVNSVVILNNESEKDLFTLIKILQTHYHYLIISISNDYNNKKKPINLLNQYKESKEKKKGPIDAHDP